MNRRYTYIYLLLTALLLTASFQLNYCDSREKVRNRINERFKEAVPYWGDSIYAMRKIPAWGRYSREAYAKKTKTTIIGELDTPGVTDTLVISARYYLPETHDEYARRGSESALIWSGNYMPVITDPFFSNLLADMGIEAEATTELHVKDLRKMFPNKDSMNVAAPIREVRRVKWRQVEGFVTDTVGIGICNHGLVVGKVAVSHSTIRNGMRWVTWRQVLVLLAMAVLYFVILYVKRIATYLQGVHFIGNTCIDFNTATLHYWNGVTLPLTNIKEALLHMLVEAAPEYLLTKEDICRTIWKRDVKDGQALYHVAVNELRGYLIASDDALSLETLPKRGIQITVDRDKLRPCRLLHYMVMRVKRK